MPVVKGNPPSQFEMEDQMMLNSKRRTMTTIRAALICLCLGFLLAICSTPSFAQTSQQGFATPQTAVDALVAAVRAGASEQVIVPVLGPNGIKILSSGDPVADESARKRFLSAYD